jgi:hypothetical protein
MPEVAREAGRRQLLTTEEMFCDWLAGAKPGQQFEYYRGLLAYDRMPSAEVLQPRDRAALVALAKRAMQVAEDGRVSLVQRRHGESDYSYIAIKCGPSPLRRGRVHRTDQPRMPASRKQASALSMLASASRTPTCMSSSPAARRSRSRPGK